VLTVSKEINIGKQSFLIALFVNLLILGLDIIEYIQTCYFKGELKINIIDLLLIFQLGYSQNK